MENDFNDECKNCQCFDCAENNLGDGKCNNCGKCSGNNADQKHKYLNNKWEMNCKIRKE